MSSYSDPITATGALITFSAPQGGKVDSLSIPLSFTQSGTGTPSVSNPRPIVGNPSINVYVSPTSDVADATTYNITFGTAGTVYAGTIDVATGSLTVTHAGVTKLLSELVLVSHKTNTDYYRGNKWLGDGIYPSHRTNNNLCNILEAFYNSNDSPHYYVDTGNGNAYIYVPSGTPTSQEVQIVCKLATEQTFSLSATTIALLSGTNNIWASNNATLTLIYRLLQAARMTGATSIGKNAASLVVSQQFNGYSKVVVNVTEELYYEAGNDTGRTLTLDCPWGTQTVADNLLALLEGFQYQPFEATDAILDPAAELGDGLTVNGVYGGIFKLTLKSGALHAVDVASPQDEEIEHEYQFIPASERKIERRLANVQSELSVQADQISAKVDREGGDPSSVEWVIDADQFVIKADGSDVLTVDENGLTVNGDGTFTGNVSAGNIQYGGSNGYMSGSGLSGGSVSKNKTNFGTTLDNADYAYDVTTGNIVAAVMKSREITVAGAKGFYYNDGNSTKRVIPVQATFYISSQGSQVTKSFTFLGFA